VCRTIQINGKQRYLWRAVDQDGEVVDIYLRPSEIGLLQNASLPTTGISSSQKFKLSVPPVGLHGFPAEDGRSGAPVVFGVLAFINPAAALLVLSIYFAASVLVGAYALINPPVSMAAFVYLVAFMAILLGVFLVMLGRKVREKIDREWILYVTGALSTIWGVLIFIQPGSGAVSVVYMIGSWAIILGGLKIIFAFKARNLVENVGERITNRAGGAT
jgi:uncharacterized membrane protein HdeD (DUF308 family)